MRLSDITPEMHARHEHDCGWLECGTRRVRTRDCRPPSAYLAHVYLAGPINDATDDEMNDWRQELIRRMPNVHFLDPTVRDYRGTEDDNVAAIVEQDKADIDDSEIVVAYCPKPSVGTSMEVFYAWQTDRPVIAWVPPGAPVSPWLRYHSHAIYQYGFQVEAAIGTRLLGVA